TLWLRAALSEARDAKRDAIDRLARANMERGRAGRFSQRIGQRFESLESLREALRLARGLRLPPDRFQEIRTEFIACQPLPDMRLVKNWDGWPTGCYAFDFDAALERYARSDSRGRTSVRQVCDDVELFAVSAYGWVNLSPDGAFLAVWPEG